MNWNSKLEKDSSEEISNTLDYVKNEKYNMIWNAAIDECIKVANKYDNPISREDNMRSLKK